MDAWCGVVLRGCGVVSPLSSLCIQVAHVIASSNTYRLSHVIGVATYRSLARFFSVRRQSRAPLWVMVVQCSYLSMSMDEHVMACVVAVGVLSACVCVTWRGVWDTPWHQHGYHWW